MSEPVLTEVRATVDPGREDDLLEGFRALLDAPVPDGLVRTELLRGAEGEWRIQTRWRDREALEAMRALPEPPAALRLFRSVDADPSVAILEIKASFAGS